MPAIPPFPALEADLAATADLQEQSLRLQQESLRISIQNVWIHFFFVVFLVFANARTLVRETAAGFRLARAAFGWILRRLRRD